MALVTVHATTYAVLRPFAALRPEKTTYVISLSPSQHQSVMSHVLPTDRCIDDTIWRMVTQNVSQH